MLGFGGPLTPVAVVARPLTESVAAARALELGPATEFSRLQDPVRVRVRVGIRVRARVRVRSRKAEPRFEVERT